MQFSKYHVVAFVLIMTLVGCSNGSDSTNKTSKPTAVKQSEAPASPSTAKLATAAPKKDTALTGTVIETFDSGGYTYIQIDNGQGKIWAAITATPVKVGQDISLINGPVMKNFHSRTLDRTFTEIVFSGGISGQQGAAHGNAATTTATNPHTATPAKANNEASFMKALTSGQENKASTAIDPALATGGSTKAIVNYQELTIPKAKDGFTVAEIFTQAAKLNGKVVKIRGKIVKVSPKIMGTNWYHIQDGSGDPMHNTHDLVVTSSQLADKDDIVVVEGTVAAKKDFGAGYFYEAIIEQAKFTK